MPSLNWIGKDKVVNHHQDVPFRVLEHVYGFTPELGTKYNNETLSGNKIIHGDNLEALKALLPEYEGKINCIYIDPPYNTGNEGWVYNDNVNDPKIKKWLHHVVGKEGEDLSRHDKWLCMMYPRLKLLHKLLSSDGVIFISIDDNEQANLKLILDEIFGMSNFISCIAVVNNFKGRSDDKYIATAHESLLMYHKGSFVTNGVPVPEEYIDEYKLKDEKGYYRVQGLRKRGAGAKREDRPNMYYPFYYNSKNKSLSLERNDENDHEIIPKLSDGSEGRWRWGKETSKEKIEFLTAQLVQGRNEYDIFQKDYLEKEGEGKRIKPKSFWHGSEFSSEAGTLQLKNILGKGVFQTPKSHQLLEYCLAQATNKDSVVLDSFAGSGTSAHAVLNLNKQDGGNRKFILIEMEDYADSITAERVKKVIQSYDEASTGLSIDAFDYYKLGAPMFDDNNNLNEEVGTERIRQYVYYTETKEPLEAGKDYQKEDIPYFLDKFNEAAYYFYYEREDLTTLNYEFLATIKTQADQYIVYADNCLLSKDFMLKKSIIFKKIPRDITRF